MSHLIIWKLIIKKEPRLTDKNHEIIIKSAELEKIVKQAFDKGVEHGESKREENSCPDFLKDIFNNKWRK